MKKLLFVFGLAVAVAVQPQAVEAQSQCFLGACWSGGQFNSNANANAVFNRDLRDWLNRFDGWNSNSNSNSIHWRTRTALVPTLSLVPLSPTTPTVGVAEPSVLFLLLAGVSAVGMLGWRRRDDLLA